MTNTYRIGTTLIDTRDGRPVVVSERRGHGVMYVRKRALSSDKWYTIRWEPGRFTRAGRRKYRTSVKNIEGQRERRRREAVERYGDEVVRLAENLKLPYHAVAKELNHV